MKVLMLGYFGDYQTGIYIMESMKKFASDVAAVDIRRVVQDIGSAESQKVILEEIEDLKIKPDMVLVLKGMELQPKTLQTIKDKYSNAIFINWLFDKYVGGVVVWENQPYLEYMKMFDYFVCSLGGVANVLKEHGVKNVEYIPEACNLEYTGKTYLNNFQKAKYGEDISFIGTLGLTNFHKNRIPLLSTISKEGFRIKIWGPVMCDWRLIPTELRDIHTAEQAINVGHSKVVQCSLINLGIDQDPDIELGQSARMYRVMGAGGFYLTNHVPKLDTMFKINKKDELPTEDLDLVVYYSVDDLIKKLDWLLEHNDVREKIALNGMKKVIENHTFEHRCKDLIKLVKDGKKRRNNKKARKEVRKETRTDNETRAEKGKDDESSPQDSVKGKVE